MKKAILFTVIVIVVLAGCGLACYHTNLYTEFEKSRIEKQLGKIYGTDFEVKSIDEPQSLFPKFGASQGFTAYSREGIFTLGECDWKGTVLTDTYCHYFYAPALNLELQNIICDCFEDFYIVRDCLEFGGNKAAVDLVAVNEEVNTDAYTTKIDRKETYFRVFLKAWDPDSPEQLDATVEQLQRVLKHLQDKGYMGNVYFMAVSEEVLIQLQHSCMDCFFAKSSVGDALAKYVTCIDRKELDQLIADPTQYIVAQHVPKQGMSCIVNPIIDPPLAP